MNNINEKNFGLPWPLGEAIITDEVGRPLVPEAVVAQEARGLRKLVQSSLLPVEMSYESWSILEAFGLGVQYGDDPQKAQPMKGDDLFTEVKLPEGWTRKGTGHNLYSDVLDEKERPRISVGYKAAHYDRWAHAHLYSRFEVRAAPEGGYENPLAKDRAEEKYVATVRDGGTVLYTTPACLFEGERWFDEPSSSTVAYRTAYQWLDDNRPGWRSPLAYWDDTVPVIIKGTYRELFAKAKGFQKVRMFNPSNVPFFEMSDMPCIYIENSRGMASIQQLGDEKPHALVVVMWEKL